MYPAPRYRELFEVDFAILTLEASTSLRREALICYSQPLEDTERERKPRTTGMVAWALVEIAMCQWLRPSGWPVLGILLSETGWCLGGGRHLT